MGIAIALSTTAAPCKAQVAFDGGSDVVELDEDAAADREWLRDHPVDISNDPLAALESAPGVPAGFARRAEEARALLPFRRVEDLLRVPGIDADAIDRLRPFVTVPLPSPRTQGRIVFEASGGGASHGVRLSERAEFARGPHLRFGGVLERDARERALDDFSSGWIEGRRGRLRLVGGALDVDWARGLALSTARAPTDAIGSLQRAFRASRGITAHRGAAEEGHFRGIAVDAQRGRLRVAAVAADTRRDARVNRDGFVTSLAEGGLHRSVSEAATRDRLRDRMIAFRGECEGPGAARLGATWRANRFDPPIAPRQGSALPHDSLESVAGLDLSIPIGVARVTGEVASRRGSGAARIAGIIVPTRMFELSAMARRYDPSFRILGTSPPGASGRTSNETGFAVGVSGRIRGWKLAAVHDRWRQMAGASTTDAPERGTRTRVQAEAGRSGRRITATVGYTSRGTSTTSGSSSGGIDEGDDGRARTTLRLQGELSLPRGARAVLVASGARIVDSDATSTDGRERSVADGGYVQGRMSAPFFWGIRSTAALSRFAGATASSVPRIAETLLPGRTLFVPLASGAQTAGSRVSLAAERRVSPSLRVALGASWQVPRAAPSKVDAAFALHVGRARLP